jgi:hypothetical protein
MEPDRVAMRALAGSLATKLVDRGVRARARDVAAGRLPADNERYWFNRICVHVRDSSDEVRIDKATRAKVIEWLARWGASLRREEPATRRLEFRLTDEQAALIREAAKRAGLSRAEYAKRATLREVESSGIRGALGNV